MTTEILQHNINFNWRDGGERELSEESNRHIIKMISDGYIEGEICQLVDLDTEEEAFGWWSISNPFNRHHRLDQQTAKFILDKLNEKCDIDYGEINEAEAVNIIIEAYGENKISLEWVFTHGGECKKCHRAEMTELDENEICFDCHNGN